MSVVVLTYSKQPIDHGWNKRRSDSNHKKDVEFDFEFDFNFGRLV